MKKPFLILKNENISIHSTFKDVCERYGWEKDTIIGYKKIIPKEYNGYLIEKKEQGLTIPCQLLRMAISSSIIDHTSETFDEVGVQDVIFELGDDRLFIIEIEIEIKEIKAEISTNRGMLNDDSTIVSLNKLNELIDSQGEIVILDQMTKDILFDYIYEKIIF
jgi:hypothetical protein